MQLNKRLAKDIFFYIARASWTSASEETGKHCENKVLLTYSLHLVNGFIVYKFFFRIRAKQLFNLEDILLEIENHYLLLTANVKH